MPDVLDHMTGALYRIGLHHEDGTASLVSLTAHPVRFAVGEVSASAADLINSARSAPRGNRLYPERDIGPSTV